jgi:c-di-GMP-binding flagellar brake protein YcgR
VIDMSDMIERRRTPRAELRATEICRLERRDRVQLLDISQSGALIGCEAGLPIGSRGQFRAGLASIPFSAEVAVKRQQVRPTAKKQLAFGTQFAAMDERSKQSLDHFLRRAKD